MKYVLQVSTDYGKLWSNSTPFIMFNNKNKVEKFIQDEIEQKGLDWRVGFLYKLRGEEIQRRFISLPT